MSVQRILVVDDEESITKSLKAVLESETVAVSTSSTIEDAEGQLKENKFDLVIADLRLTGMLGMEGLELISYVKDHEPDTRVVLMTAYGSEEIQAEAMRRGASAYWQKPVSIPDMISEIRGMGIAVGKAS